MYKDYGFSDSMLDKRRQLISKGVNPYPYDFPDSQEIGALVESAKKCEEDGDIAEHPSIRVAGRIWGIRKMGKIRFMDLSDSSGKIQLYFAKKTFSEIEWGQLDLLDLGDLIGIDGTLFRTRSGELTINVEKFIVLAKAVVPIPIGKETDEKVYYRVSDPETRYRERYLHWLLDQDDYERIRKRGQIISSIRNQMELNGFLEVSTPAIEFVYGGAEARPFKTSIWALGSKDAFLRISPELYLKRYIVAGFKKVFTICKNFRNEGIDHSHNPEFTMMEWYEAFTDYEFQMKRFEDLVAHVCVEVTGSTKVPYQGTELDFTPPWPRLTMLDALKTYASIEAASMSVEQLKAELESREIEYFEPLSWGIAVMLLFEATCEEHLVQPIFILDHPIEVSPLTKGKRGDERLVERFEPFAYRMEIGNAYSELTDPVDQLDRFIKQREMQTKTQDGEKDYVDNPLDIDFVKAIGCGMPPTGGVGLGIDRLIMLLTDAPSIRDIIPFPMVKPRNV
jgi:lysyl-tRNA synthetase, class II